jgi:hypothetical protein
MPGPQNAKKKRRAQQKKHHARAHPSTPAQKTRPVSPDISSPTPTLVTLLSCPPIAAKEADEAETLCPGPHIKSSVHDNTRPPSYDTPYGPRDDPTLILLSNPIIMNHGNGPRVQDMRAFLNSCFAPPPWTDDPLCAEFSQREILQMLCTVLPEETALVRLRSHYPYHPRIH